MRFSLELEESRQAEHQKPHAIWHVPVFAFHLPLLLLPELPVLRRLSIRCRRPVICAGFG